MSVNRYELKGLGDVVNAVTTVTGVKAAVDAVSRATGKDCGCGKRRDRLNQAIPFRRRSDDLQRDKNSTQ